MFDRVVFRAGRLRIGPVPADRHARVVEAVNLVMGDAVVRGVGHPETDALGVHVPAIVNVVVDDLVVAGHGLVGFRHQRFANNVLAQEFHLSSGTQHEHQPVLTREVDLPMEVGGVDSKRAGPGMPPTVGASSERR